MRVVVEGLLGMTGRWPLLLRLVSRVLADYAEVSAGVPAQEAVLLERLRQAGPAAVDEFLSHAGRGLDVDQPEQRARAVRATIGASTSLLADDDADRFAELGVFAEDEVIPFAADLAVAGTARAARLRAVLARTAHLLAPSEPTETVVDVLHSRVASDTHWGPHVTALRGAYRRPRLVNRWPLPDLPDKALRRVLTGHDGWVVAVAPDGSWLATGSAGQTVRIWDTATGQERAVLTGHTDEVQATAVAPDGSWLATGSIDRTVRIWDVTAGQTRALMRLDSDIHAAAWLGTTTLALGGPAGLYLFDFLAGTSPPVPDAGSNSRPQ